MPPNITAIEVISFTYPLDNVGWSPKGLEYAYEPGASVDHTGHAVRVETGAGVTGEYVGGTGAGIAQLRSFADGLVGRSALAREAIWYDLKRTLRKYDGTGIGPLDVALWDLAGKHHDAPIHALLGTYRTELPAYVSTYSAGENGLDSPEAYAEFGAEVRDLGFPGYKLHTWRGQEAVDIDREVETVRAVGERLGDDLDLMHDPVCEYETYGQALRVGRELDRQGYFWYEDPLGDGGRSEHANARLADSLETPLLLTEQTRWLEPKTDAVVAGATDFLRADVDLDGGITGAMKAAHVAEGFGIDMEYHLPSPATRHCMAATRNANYYEVGVVGPKARTPHNEPPIYDEYTDSIDAVEDGCYPVPNGPGLGVSIDWEYVRENAVRTTRHEG